MYIYIYVYICIYMYIYTYRVCFRVQGVPQPTDNGAYGLEAWVPHQQYHHALSDRVL